MKKYRFFHCLAGFVAGVILLAGPPAAQAQQTELRNLYVRIDLDSAAPDQTSYMYREEVVGGVLRLCEFGTRVGKTTKFELWELIGGTLGDWVWFRGVSDVRVLIGDEPDCAEVASLSDFSSNPAYRRMNHHMVLKAESSIRSGKDPCSNRMWPVAAGQEMTHYDFRDIDGQTEYGMLFKPDDEMQGIDWHWHNPSGVTLKPGEAVYLRFTIVFDTINSPTAYNDVNVSWVSINPCGHEICISSGTQTTFSTNWNVPTGFGGGTIVLAMPHVHDHVEWMRLIRNQDLLFTATPVNDDEFSNHHCPCIRTNRISELTDDNDDECTNEQCPGRPCTGWHDHDGHLTWGGLQNSVVYDGETGETFSGGDTITVEMRVDVPDHLDSSGEQISIDGMGIWMLFWEEDD